MGATKDLRETVEAELRSDPLVDETDIAVKNISGNVALNGTVATYPQYREAAAAAQRVSGVTAVHNHLQVVLDHDHYRDDALLTTAANNALMADVGVPDGVEAIAADGNITLTGTVGSGAQRAAAAEAVSGLMGVRNVNNDLEVASTADAYNVNVHVQEALERYAAGPDDSDVYVGANGNAITLCGHVRTWAEHDAVVTAARMGAGVSDVFDELDVTG